MTSKSPSAGASEHNNPLGMTRLEVKWGEVESAGDGALPLTHVVFKMLLI